MSAGIVSMTGDRELLAALNRLERGAQDKIVKPSLAKGITVVARRARANQRHKSLKRLVGSKVIRRKRDREYSAKVYMKPSEDRTITIAGREVGFEAVGTILEFGSSKRGIAPQPFMRPALAQAKGAALDKIAAEARRRIQKAGGRI